MKCIKKPILFEAYQYGVGNAPDWYQKALSERKIFELHGETGCYVDTPHGRKYAEFADYIVIDGNGNLRVYKPDVFEEAYEVVE